METNQTARFYKRCLSLATFLVTAASINVERGARRPLRNSYGSYCRPNSFDERTRAVEYGSRSHAPRPAAERKVLKW
ncbi:hypothetical protein EDD17DRAFT_1550123 [Pisolithus thermaeus]|nr:hypothetical protein EDD17DRAFT_1550123 [Pisolithus thermaeus]